LTAIIALGLAIPTFATPGAGAAASRAKAQPQPPPPIDLTLDNLAQPVPAPADQALSGAPATATPASTQSASAAQGAELVPRLRAELPMVPTPRESALRDHVFSLDLRTPF
jgi:hypothetical protein